MENNFPYFSMYSVRMQMFFGNIFKYIYILLAYWLICPNFYGQRFPSAGQHLVPRKLLPINYPLQKSHEQRFPVPVFPAAVFPGSGVFAADLPYTIVLKTDSARTGISRPG